MQKIIRWVFVIFLMLSLLSLFTPLTFNYFWLTNTVYIITVALSFFAARTITNKFLRSAVRILPALLFFSLLMLSYIRTPLGNNLTSGWRTVWIEYRNIKHPGIYIAHQMMDIGGRGYARRTVKVISILPFAGWVTTVSDTLSPGEGWKKVNEELDPFNLNGG